MKAMQLVIVSVIFLSFPSYALPSQDEELWKDMHSILKEYHFHLPSDSRWNADGNILLAQSKVFTGSAVFVVDEPASPSQSYTELAIRICNGFRTLYGMDSTNDGSRVVPSDTGKPQIGESYLKWTNEDSRHKGDESVTLRVQVVALPNATIGILLTLVHVSPQTVPSALSR